MIGLFRGHALGSTVSRSNVNGALEHFIRPGIALAVVTRDGGGPDGGCGDSNARGGGGPGGGCGDSNARGGGGSSGGAGARFSEQLIQPSRPPVRGGCHDPEAAETALTIGHRYAIFAKR